MASTTRFTRAISRAARPCMKCCHSLLCRLVVATLFAALTANGQQPRPELTPGSTSIAFGVVQIGTESSPTETLVNYGGTSIIVSAVSVSGAGFSLSGLSLPLTLNAGENTSFTVTFHPASAGFASGTVTITSDGSNPNLSIPLYGLGADIKALPECSLARTNKSCKVIIDREKPLTPPTIQMYSGQTVTAIVKAPKTFERYFLDYQTGQANLSPDVASTIVQGFLPSLAKVGEFHAADAVRRQRVNTDQCAADEITGTTLPEAEEVADVVPAFRKCLAQLGANAIDIYQKLEAFIAPDSLTAQGTAKGGNLNDLKKPISAFLTSEFKLSGKIASIAGDKDLKVSIPDAAAISELSDLQKGADAIANDLLGYSQRIRDLDDFNQAFPLCNSIVKVRPAEEQSQTKCVGITSNPDDEHVYQNMTTRTITYSLNTLNLVSNSREAATDPTKKKLLASIVVNFADSPSKPSALRLEGSAGVFFSSLPIRSFSVAPIFTNGAITNNIIAQNILHPTVVPFAAANYRITDDLGWIRWKSNVYLTGAVGVNPNTVSADFGVGPSLSWRGLMLSALWHYGHDVRLTQGLSVGESLGASFKGSLATQTYWTSSFALGVSVRVPSLTGR
jgi:hypothetical protein